jgi:hypothetical protein
MDRKLCSVMLVLFLGISVTSFAQGQGQNRGPGGPPPAVANPHIEHGGGDHGPSDHANKPSEPNKSLNSGRNDVATRLSADTKLSSKLQAMLPAGMTVQTAAMGFKNLGQFIAAVHVSKNLNIPFDQLKGAVVTNHKSLGDAIHDLKPDLSTETAKTEAKKAEDEAKDDTRKPS